MRYLKSLLLSLLALASLSSEAHHGRGAAAGGFTPPGKPSFTQLVNQGGPTLVAGNTGPGVTNQQVVWWLPATPGSNSISSYNIKRSGSVLATGITPTSFTATVSGTTLTASSVTGTIFANIQYSCTPNALAVGTMINAKQLSGTTGAAGTYQVNISQTVASTTCSALEYVDTTATNSNSPNSWSSQVTPYTYSVAAVDSASNVGLYSSQYQAYWYQHGYSFTSNGDLSFGTTPVPNSTSGNPQGGIFDMQLPTNSGWQPTSDSMLAPTWDGEIGGFNYFTIDINPGSTLGWTGKFCMVSRLPGTGGDAFPWLGQNTIIDLLFYGPGLVANTWGTYKIPLTAADMGVGLFTGSIAANGTLSVSASGGAPCVDVVGWVSDGGAHITTPVFTTGFPNGQTGCSGVTFTVAQALFTGSISGTTLTVTSVQYGTITANMFLQGVSNPGCTGPVPTANTEILSGSGTTWTVNNSQTTGAGTCTYTFSGYAGGAVASESMTFQRTQIYKFFIAPQGASPTMYVNNFGFLSQ